MLKRSFLVPALFVFVSFLSCNVAFSQASIQQQFDQFYENETSSWQEYKLVKQPKLKEFWTVVSDTLRIKNENLAKRSVEINSLKVNIDTLNNRVATLETNLAESRAVNNEIYFIGIPMAKSAYNIMVWLIILVLAVGVGVVYMMYMRSNSVTKKVQKAYSSLENEYTEHKNRSRESQVKLKRELQTALNTLHDNRINK